MTMHRANAESIPPPVSIAVFARAPIAGHAKTRLIPHLGAQGAARLQEMLMRRALHIAVDAAVGPVSLWCAPDAEHPAFIAARIDHGVPLHTQDGHDLGDRMRNAFELLCGSGPTLLIGTDCPALTSATLRDAARRLLEGDEAVFVPAEDGGYVLIGLRQSHACLFDRVPWSTDQVMAETRERLREARLQWREVAAAWDVDRPEDFVRLAESGLMPQLAEVWR